MKKASGYLLVVLFLAQGAWANNARPEQVAKSYRNIDATAEISPFYRSVKLDPAPCKDGGYQVTFYGASPMNFCVGPKQIAESKWKVCVGKEVGEYPFPRRCIGFKKTVTQVTTTQVVFDRQTNTLSRTEDTVLEGKLTHTETFAFQERGSELELTHSFRNADGREGTQQFTYVEEQR